jgi:hypothetical protein
MSLTTDPNDPRLGHGGDTVPGPQNAVYLVLSEEERAKGFVEPVRRSYRHVGDKPTYPLRDLTLEEKKDHPGYAKYEKYPDSELPRVGRWWTAHQLAATACGEVTTMGLALCETYARNPHFYGSTYCVTCCMHLPVAEFVWIEADGSERVKVGSRSPQAPNAMDHPSASPPASASTPPSTPAPTPASTPATVPLPPETP